MEEIVIVGGGISGLSCLNALLDKDIFPLLIEANLIGAPKICGEFIAPVAVKYLEPWKISPIELIHTGIFYSNKKSFQFNFPERAGAISRQSVELQLAKRAMQMNGRIIEKSPIKEIIPQQGLFKIYLHTGELITTKSIVLATGKIGETKKIINKTYVGLKFHMPMVTMSGTLQMFSLNGGYFGIVPVSDKLSNCAALFNSKIVCGYSSLKNFLYHSIQKNKYLTSIFEQIDFEQIDLLEGKNATFAMKHHPHWPNAYWIGDAIATLHPAIGSGFAHGITSGLLAAEYFLLNNSKKFRLISERHAKQKLKYGKVVHQLFLNPKIADRIIPLIKMPKIVQFVLNKLNYLSE